MDDVRIAAAQMRCLAAKPETNLQRSWEFILEAKKQKAEIILFPELSITGYLLDPEIRRLAEYVPGPSSSILSEMAQETGLTILAGIAEKDDSGAVYNTHLVAGPQGFLGKYRKLHINSVENRYWTGGGSLPYFRHPKVRYGIEICYDSHFGELTRLLALKSVELLLLPHASSENESFDQKKARWLRYMPARAYDNCLYLVVCNQVGDNGAGTTFPGVTWVIDPQGNILHEAKPNEEDLLVADLNSQYLREVREHPYMNFLSWRRPQCYEQDSVVEAENLNRKS